MESDTQSVRLTPEGVSLESERPFWVGGLIVLSAVSYCAFHYWMGHLKVVHFLFTALVLSLFFLSRSTRVFLFLAVPFILKDIFFDSFRYIPFEWLKPIRVVEPYVFDRFLFGIPFQNTILLLNEYLLRFAHPLWDFAAGFVYFLNEPVAILMILLLWKKRSFDLAGRYSVAFLLMNLLADLTYFLYPAAAPWYVAKYGFVQPLSIIPGDPAGLVNFDRLLGLSLSSHFYGMSPVVFGAIPSMHAGFTMLCWLYSFRMGWRWALGVGIYTLCMCWGALYLQHHYMIDLVVGVLYAAAAYLIVEGLCKQGCKRFFRFLRKNLLDQGPRPFLGSSRGEGF